MKLELDLPLEVAVGLGLDAALDVVRPEDGLLELDVSECDEGEAERLEAVALLLVVEDHPVGGEVEAAVLVAAEHGPTLPREGHAHVVAEEQNAEKFTSW